MKRKPYNVCWNEHSLIRKQLEQRAAEHNDGLGCTVEAVLKSMLLHHSFNILDSETVPAATQLTALNKLIDSYCSLESMKLCRENNKEY